MIAIPDLDKWQAIATAKERAESSAAFGARNAVKKIAGFGRDWSRGIHKPVLVVPLADCFYGERRVEQVA